MNLGLGLDLMGILGPVHSVLNDLLAFTGGILGSLGGLLG